MANYEILKSAIQQVIKTNGNNEIKGALLQQSLLAMINSLGDGYIYIGIATPTTNPGTPDQRIFYIAAPGTYTNFSGIVVDDGEIAILKYDNTWHKDSTNIATKDVVNLLREGISGIKYIIDGNITKTFIGTGSEHSATIDKIIINGKSGDVVRVKLDVGTATTDSTQIRVRSYKDNEVVYAMYVEGASQAEYSLPLTIGQEIQFTLARDADELGFYIYRITQSGTFIASISNSHNIQSEITGIKTNVANLESSVDEIRGQITIHNNVVFNVRDSSHSSADDRLTFNASSGETIKVRLNEVTGKYGIGKLRLYSYYNNALVRAMYLPGASQSENVLRLNMEQDLEIKLTSDIDALGIYMDGITTPGTFMLEAWKIEEKYISGNYIDRFVQSKLKRIDERPTFSILHFSDIHSDENTLGRIMAFNENINYLIDDVLCTGDVVWNYGDEADGTNRGFAYWARRHANNVLLSIGNHDVEKSAGGILTETECYTKYYAPFLTAAYGNVTFGGENVCYYYKDYTTAKVRLIVLDWAHQTEAQKEWFANALNGANTNGYAVVCVNHCPFEWDYMTKQNNRFDAILPLGVNNQVLEIDFATMVDTFIGNGGIFVCWLAGHTHRDIFSVLENHNRQAVVNIAQSTILQDARQSDIWRMANTSAEDCFNIFTVNTNRGIFSIFRVGADVDCLQRSRKSISWDYINKIIISEE